MIQHDNVIVIEKAEETKNIISILNSNFPNIIGRIQFFEKFTGYDIKILNQVENEENFFDLLVGKRFEVILHWAFAVLKMIENNFSHIHKLAHLLTFVNYILRGMGAAAMFELCE